MCGGMTLGNRKPERNSTDTTYAPPKLPDVYGQFRETGQVPYSYYGVAAPTREGELDLVRKSYPTAFSQSTAAAPPKKESQLDRFLRLLNFDLPDFWIRRD